MRSAHAQQLSDHLRSVFVPASEELQSLIASVEAEVSDWPTVQIKPMFGMKAIYRGKSIFALLPKTRSLRSGDEVWLKFPNTTAAVKRRISAEARIVPPRKPTGAQWYTVKDVKPDDYGWLIDWLSMAYKSARKK